jgi:multiple sugar transport system permease protein
LLCPNVVGLGVALSVIWSRLLDADGPVNQTLRSLGVAHPPGWLSDPDFALYSLASIVSWQMLGFCVVVYLAGLQRRQGVRKSSGVLTARPMRS